MNKKLNVVYASDDNFAEILGVSLESLYDNNRDMEEIYVYIFDNNIKQSNKTKIESLSRKYKRKHIIWVKDKDITKILNINVNTDRGSASQYARLFISSVLPKDVHRVLYLDCDTIVNKSLDELWNLDLHGNTIAALLDAFSKYYRANIGLQPDDIMFNSGVMLVDLDRWRETNVETRLLQFIRAKNGIVQQGDQGALNAILTNSCYVLEPKFNSVTIFYDFTYEDILTYRKPPKYYNKNQIQESINNPVIIHYTTSFLSERPWIVGCKHKYVDKWRYYKSIGPWKNARIQKSSNLPVWKRLGRILFKVFPRAIAIRIASIPQAYLRPIKYSDNK